MTRLIRARTVPPSLPGHLAPRSRLRARLCGLIEAHRVVCVYATAGAGKTTAVLDAAASLGERPVAYLTVEPTDAATGRLLSYLEAALARVVPGLDGVVGEALAAGVPHAEVAGLLAESVGPVPVLVVIDDLERLADAPGALAVLSTFLRYLPPAARAVLCGRIDVRLDLGSTPVSVGGLGEADLAFTVDEAGAALAAAGRAEIDPVAAVEQTGGWVTGILFEAWRAAGHVAGTGGEADALHGYLASQILDQLPSEDREFLVTTALLDPVSAWRAEALGVDGAAARLTSLRARYLPVAIEGDELRCHPCFREYLLEQLGRREPAEVARLRAAHARLLAAEGHLEEAAEEWLAAGCADEARRVVSETIEVVLDRADFGLAERWLAALPAERRRVDAPLLTAELMLAISGEDYTRATAAAEALSPGERDDLARSSSRAAGLLGWAAFHAGQPDAARRLAEIGRPGAPVDALRYGLDALCADRRPEPVALQGGPFDALLMRVDYYRGLFSRLTETPALPWAVLAAAPWRIAALLALGRTGEAHELHEQVAAGDRGLWFSAVLSVKVAYALDRPGDTWEALNRGRERIRASGSVMLGLQSLVDEARLVVGFGDDPARALAALDVFDAHPAAGAYPFIVEQADTWRGLVLLRTGDDAGALDALRRATDSAERGGRVLCLPTAAVLRSEAAWRAGCEEEADRAADVALAAARAQGSNHLLLRALRLFPAVLSRRLDAEAGHDSPWHGLGRALRAQRAPAVVTATATDVTVVEFGRLAVVADGVEIKPRIRKSCELVAYLAAAPGQSASRAALLEALFEGRADESTAAYLRQAVAKARAVLPDVVLIASPAGGATPGGSTVFLNPERVVTSESVRLEGLFAEAARRQGDERLAALEACLALAEAGEYLPGVESAWAAQRRYTLAARTAEARYAAAELCFRRSRYEDTERLAGDVVANDPFAEAAWRLLMQAADALGDHDRVATTYAACRARLAELDAEPSPATHELFAVLRR